MIFVYVVAVLTTFQGLLTLIDGIRSAQFMRLNGSFPVPAVDAGSGSVAVFCPCKGVDFEFEKNVRSILDQDFPRFTVCFIVESVTDPAFDALKKIGADHVLVAGESAGCGQKVHNLRYAVERIDRELDVYVFCDSDARYPRNWLAALTASLLEKSSEICTGYRWYAVRRFHLPTLLRSAWNASALGVLGDHGRNFAWGGSTAIRRDTFERIGVLEAWAGALSDDYAITRAAQAAGVRVRFLPSCLIPSYGECSFAELLEFTTRQIIITRVYHPKLWALGLIAQTTFNLSFWGLAIAISTQSSGFAVLLWTALFGLSIVRCAVRFSAVRSVLNDVVMPGFGWFYSVSSPLVALLYQYNMVCAAFTRSIEWRQIHYDLVSPNETRVRRLRYPIGG